MAKEGGDLKKVDLKVSVNCCDGCKRKVKKALLGLDGVYKAQIDPYQPKVTVIGNVEAQTLIKKLAKAGKAAEPWPTEAQKPTESKENKVQSGIDRKETQHVETITTSFKESKLSKDSKTDDKKCICSTSSPAENYCHYVNREVKEGNSSNVKEEKLHDKESQNCCTVNACGSKPQGAKNVTFEPQPGIVHEAAVCCAPPPYVPHHYYELQGYSSSMLQPIPRFTDYFNDDNTVGCSIM